jgi:hypothetical protein
LEGIERHKTNLERMQPADLDLIDRYALGSYYPRIQKAFRARQVHQTKDESFPRQQSVNL